MSTAYLLSSKPDHVPLELVYDIDIYNLPGLVDGYTDDIHVLWKDIQDTHPDIFWTPRNGGHWFVTRHDILQRAGVDAKRFSNRDIFVPQGSAPFLTPTNCDPPDHTAFRKLLMPTFSPAMVAKASDQARQAAITLIERIKPNGGCEFIGEFSAIMPVVAFMTLVNLPLDDLDRLLAAAGTKKQRGEDDAKVSWDDLSVYVQAQIDNRRADPQPDDFISSLLVAEIGGRRLSQEEIFSLALLVISGGLDTVAIELSFIAAFLAQNPDHRRRLVEDPALFDRAIEEFTRRFGVSNIARVAVADTELDGIPIKAGESVMLLYSIAGLDERVNDRPLEVDFERRGGRHLIFGTGVHTCIGNRLAKREMRLFLEEWLARIPNFRLAPGTRPKMHSGIVNQVAELQLVWDA